MMVLRNDSSQYGEFATRALFKNSKNRQLNLLAKKISLRTWVGMKVCSLSIQAQASSFKTHRPEAALRSGWHENEGIEASSPVKIPWDIGGHLGMAPIWPRIIDLECRFSRFIWSLWGPIFGSNWAIARSAHWAGR